MAIAVIDAWLKGPRDYSEGLKLFDEHSKNTFLKRILADGEDDYNANRLLKELQKLNEAAGPAMPVKKVKPSDPGKPVDFSAAMKEAPPLKQRFLPKNLSTVDFDPVTSVSFKPVDVSKLPEDLQRLAAKKGQMYKMMCAIHGELLHLPTDQERKEAVNKVINLAEQIQEIHDEFDYFQEYGVVRPKTGKYDIMAMTPTQLMARRNTLRTYISRARTGRREANFETVSDWEEEMVLIDKKLHAGEEDSNA